MVTISLACWNRPIYLLQVLNWLGSCRNIEKYRLLISCDHFNYSNRAQILSAINLSNIASYIETDVFFHENNIGSAANTKYCLERGFENGEGYHIHLEDDTLPAVDMLEYFEQIFPLLDIDKFFAACTMHRGGHQPVKPNVSDANKLVSRKWFESSNAFGITKIQWNRILEMGGMFGISYMDDYARTPRCFGNEWLSHVNIVDYSCPTAKFPTAWDWPFVKYFSEQKPCVYPVVSRVYNIGANGLHYTEKSHNEYMVNENWIHSSDYSCHIYQPTTFNTEIYNDTKTYVEKGIYSDNFNDAIDSIGG